MRHNKAVYKSMMHRREQALRNAAVELGEGHPVFIMVGSLTYYRHDWELGLSNDLLDKAAYGAGALDGMYKTLINWARVNDKTAYEVLQRYWSKYNASTFTQSY